MIEIITVVSLIMLVRFLIKPRKKKKGSFAGEKEKSSRKQEPASIVGESNFVLGLCENENTDWVEQLSSSSYKNANRISALIDLHLGRLSQPNSNVKPDDGLKEFDIGEYVR